MNNKNIELESQEELKTILNNDGVENTEELSNEKTEIPVDEKEVEVSENTDETIEEVEETTAEVEETVKEEIEIEESKHTLTILGKIKDCQKLNVRKEANKEADIIIIIDKESELIIDKSKSTDIFYSVEVDGKFGYAMKKFVRII